MVENPLDFAAARVVTKLGDSACGVSDRNPVARAVVLHCRDEHVVGPRRDRGRA